jgi:hypothetical protein
MSTTDHQTMPVSRIGLTLVPAVETKDRKHISTVVHDWTTAALALTNMAAGPLVGRGYTLKATVSWADDYTITMPWIIVQKDRIKDLGAYVRQHWLALAGLQKPKGWSDERYDKDIVSNPLAKSAMISATAALKHYSLTDAAPEKKPEPSRTPVPDWPEKSEIGHLVTLIAGIVKRVEDPSFRGMRDAGQLRDASMELRKALACLIRAEDIV